MVLILLLLLAGLTGPVLAQGASTAAPLPVTADATGVATGHVTLAVISDLNDAYGSTSYGPQVHDAVARLIALRPDLVLCTGDMVAGQKTGLSDDTLRAMWSAFDAVVRRPLAAAGIPLAVTFGNHDGPRTGSHAHEGRIADAFWRDRRPPLDFRDASSFPRRYSFTCGGIFLAAIDASVAALDGAQRDWLAGQLSGEAARAARLRVVFGHLPLYAVAQGRDRAGDVLADADDLHAWLESLGVDWYLSGHHHAFYPSRKGHLRLLSAGALGGGPRKLLGDDRPPVKTLTILRLAPTDRDFQVLTLDLTHGGTPLSVRDLPPEIHGFNGVSRRLER